MLYYIILCYVMLCYIIFVIKTLLKKKLTGNPLSDVSEATRGSVTGKLLPSGQFPGESEEWDGPCTAQMVVSYFLKRLAGRHTVCRCDIFFFGYIYVCIDGRADVLRLR